MKDTAGKPNLTGLCCFVLGAEVYCPSWDLETECFEGGLWSQPLASSLEVLHSPFVLFRCFACVEGSKVPAFTGLRIFLTRVKAIFTRLEFPNHVHLLMRLIG